MEGQSAPQAILYYMHASYILLIAAVTVLLVNSMIQFQAYIHDF